MNQFTNDANLASSPNTPQFGQASMPTYGSLFAVPFLVLKLARIPLGAASATNEDPCSGGKCGNHCPSLSFLGHTQAAVVGYQTSQEDLQLFEAKNGKLPVGHILIAVPEGIWSEMQNSIDRAALQTFLKSADNRFLISGLQRSPELRNFVESTGEVQIYVDEDGISLPRAEKGAFSRRTAQEASA